MRDVEKIVKVLAVALIVVLIGGACARYAYGEMDLPKTVTLVVWLVVATCMVAIDRVKKSRALLYVVKLMGFILVLNGLMSLYVAFAEAEAVIESVLMLVFGVLFLALGIGVMMVKQKHGKRVKVIEKTVLDMEKLE